jgi:hypothetical protein
MKREEYALTDGVCDVCGRAGRVGAEIGVTTDRQNKLRHTSLEWFAWLCTKCWCANLRKLRVRWAKRREEERAVHHPDALTSLALEEIGRRLVAEIKQPGELFSSQVMGAGRSPLDHS